MLIRPPLEINQPHKPRHSFNWYLAREALLVAISGLILFVLVAAFMFSLIVIADALGLGG